MSQVPADNRPNIDLPNDICDYIGLLRDEEIRAAIAKNLLLVQERTDPTRVRQASYELRLMDNDEFLVLGQAAQGEAIAKYERPANGIGQRLTIEPGQTVKVYTIEIFNLPTILPA